MGGLSKTEREEFDIILNPTDDGSGKFSDAWRHLHPGAQEYTLVTVHHHRRAFLLYLHPRHSGDKFGSWRLDSFIVSSSPLQSRGGVTETIFSYLNAS
jgi:AP endonuclease-1